MPNQNSSARLPHITHLEMRPLPELEGHNLHGKVLVAYTDEGEVRVPVIFTNDDIAKQPTPDAVAVLILQMFQNLVDSLQDCVDAHYKQDFYAETRD